MAEAVAGLSLAANILQMVEYGAVFVTTAWKIHSAHTDIDIVRDFKQLQYLAKDVDGVLGSLDQGISAASSVPTGSESGDPELARLADECRKVTMEILQFLGKTGDQKSWKTKMHKAVKEAFQLTWGQDKLAKLQTRLDGMRSQLTLRLVYSLRNFATASSERQEMILQRIIEETTDHNDKLEKALGIGLGTASVNLISWKIDEKLAGRQPAEIKTSLKSNILKVISDPGRAVETTEIPEPRIFEVTPSRRQILKQKLLENLSYPDMLLREKSVVTASETTFRWIFEREQQSDRPWASFCEWLETTDKQLYWITGKPGSGKSTLMKFVSQPPGNEPMIEVGISWNEPRCLSFLKSWAGSDPLVVASYYFWAFGSPMQRSKEGMLRSLLHGLFGQSDPEVVATIMPESWEALHLFDEDLQVYDEDSLKALLSRAFKCMCPTTKICLFIVCPTTKICLFIDGLDEFEGQHEDLVLYLSAVLKTHPIKLCVSSRQWQVFEDAFHDTPSLRLQDLTLPDMTEYVRSELYAGAAFAQLRKRDPFFSDKLNEDVALRSNGVFLWLKLVVKSLRKGIRAGDRVSDLQARLNQLPQDLEPLFERILNELDPEYLDHAIQYFRLMEARREIGLPNIMVFSYADEEDETFGINCPVSELDMETYEGRRDYLKRRLNSRCMGLLEVTEPPPPPRSVHGRTFLFASQSRVNYLHRTVGDYMSREEVRENLSRRASQGFERGDDLHLRLCSSELAFFKSSPSALQPEGLGHDATSLADVPLRNCLRHAAQVRKSSLQTMLRLVAMLEKLYPVYYKSHNSGHTHPPNEGLSPAPPEHSRAPGSVGPAFIIHAIECGVVEYVRAKAQRQDAISHRQDVIPHQKHSVNTLKFWRRRTRKVVPFPISVSSDMWSKLEWLLAIAVFSPSPSPNIVELLLGRGADPRYKEVGESLSIWQFALISYMRGWQEESQEREKREQIVALMVKYGAPTDTKVIAQAYQQMAKQRNMVEKDDCFCSTIEDQLATMKHVSR